MTPFLLPRLCAAVCLLTILSLGDLRTRTVPLLPLFLFAGGSLLLHLFVPGLHAADSLTGALPGLLLLLPALLPHAGIGTGDGLTAAACGFLIGFWAELSALLAALLLCAAFVLALLLLRRIGRRDALPFLPFLALGHAVLLLMEVLT